MNQSFLQNHYELKESDLGYLFKTDKDIIYEVTFISYPSISEYLSANMYMFNIERLSSQENDLGQNDEKVRNTIFFVLYKFFNTHEDALITICDITDGRQAARKRLFDSWYLKYNNGFLSKFEADFFIGNNQSYASLFVSYKNKNKTSLEKEFKKLVDINFYS